MHASILNELFMRQGLVLTESLSTVAYLALPDESSASRTRSFSLQLGECTRMMDVVYVILTAGLLGLSWGLVRLCDRV